MALGLWKSTGSSINPSTALEDTGGRNQWETYPHMLPDPL